MRLVKQLHLFLPTTRLQNGAGGEIRGTPFCGLECLHHQRFSLATYCCRILDELLEVKGQCHMDTRRRDPRMNSCRFVDPMLAQKFSIQRLSVVLEGIRSCNIGVARDKNRGLYRCSEWIPHRRGAWRHPGGPAWLSSSSLVGGDRRCQRCGPLLRTTH